MQLAFKSYFLVDLDLWAIFVLEERFLEFQVQPVAEYVFGIQRYWLWELRVDVDL